MCRMMLRCPPSLLRLLRLLRLLCLLCLLHLRFPPLSTHHRSTICPPMSSTSLPGATWHQDQRQDAASTLQAALRRHVLTRCEHLETENMFARCTSPLKRLGGVENLRFWNGLGSSRIRDDRLDNSNQKNHKETKETQPVKDLEPLYS